MEAEDESVDAKSMPERVAELERENNDLRIRLDAMSKKFDRMVEFLIGNEADFAEDRFDQTPPLWEQLRTVEQQAADADQAAENALGIVTAMDSDKPNKTRIAEDISKNYLVKIGALNDDHLNDPKIRNPKVQEMAEPEYDLAWAIVDNAWGNLAERWDCFEIRQTDDDGKVLGLTSQPSKALVSMVERNLGRDDLAKRFFGRDGAKEGSLRG